MEYISVKEAAEKWGISERRVRSLCTQGRIEGVAKCGKWVWSIPSTLPKPTDGRTLRYIKNRNLKTGIQNYKQIDDLSKKAIKKYSFSIEEIISIISLIFKFDGKNINKNSIKQVLNFKTISDLDLKTQILILNINGALNYSLQKEVSEKTALKLNERILLSIDEKNSGKFLSKKSKEQFEALFSQYLGSWSVLHPLARSVFLFGEILRTKPFKKENTSTAFLLLYNSLLMSNIPYPVFDEDRIEELQSALSSTSMRGNYQKLIAFINYLILKENN